MTRESLQARKEELQQRRDALVDQLTETDSQSASISAGGGSKSFTNRQVDDIKKKIAFIDQEIARIGYALGECPNPNAPTTVEVRFNG